jgi:hypothetical protein
MDRDGLRQDLDLLGTALVYANTNDCAMSWIIEDHNEDQVANGQTNLELRVSWAASEVDFQSMDAIDNVGDLLRFFAISTRMIFEQRLFRDGNQHSGTRFRRNQSSDRTAELPR